MPELPGQTKWDDPFENIEIGVSIQNIIFQVFSVLLVFHKKISNMILILICMAYNIFQLHIEGQIGTDCCHPSKTFLAIFTFFKIIVYLIFTPFRHVIWDPVSKGEVNFSIILFYPTFHFLLLSFLFDDLPTTFLATHVYIPVSEGETDRISWTYGIPGSEGVRIITWKDNCQTTLIP